MRSLLFTILFLTLTSAAFAADADYVIGDGDVLQVSVWGAPELSAQVTVRPDGKITLPAAGEVVATGLTPSELGKKLEQAMARLVKGPVVTLTVAQVTNNKIYVSGGGVPSEVVNLPARTTLFKFLCRFGNLENADLGRASLMREGKKLDLNLESLVREGDFTQDIELRAEDILFIPSNEKNRIYVLGAVNTPRFVFYRPGIKVMDAILDANGFTDYAKENNVAIHRANGERVRVRARDLVRGRDLSQNILLEPGDYVIVGESIF